MKEKKWTGRNTHLVFWFLISWVFSFCFFFSSAKIICLLIHRELSAPSLSLALNTSISFVTNTNWQSYSGETTLSYLVQMAGLTVQNFLSAATGIAVLFALIRGLVRKTTDNIGNFWKDATRSVLYVLLPLSILLAIILTGQGVVEVIPSICEGDHINGFRTNHSFRSGIFASRYKTTRNKWWGFF